MKTKLNQQSKANNVTGNGFFTWKTLKEDLGQGYELKDEFESNIGLNLTIMHDKF